MQVTRFQLYWWMAATAREEGRVSDAQELLSKALSERGVTPEQLKRMIVEGESLQPSSASQPEKGHI